VFAMYAGQNFVTCGPWSPLPDTTTLMNSITIGDFVGQCSLSLASYYQNSYWSSNALKGATGTYPSPGSFGSGNVLANAFQKPADNTVIKFTSCGAFGGDCHLTSSSPYSAANGSATQLATDGTDLGADIDVINQATSGAASGLPPWDQRAALQVDPASTRVIFRYTAPTSAACTSTLYTTQVRNLAGGGNIVGSPVADSASTSVSDSTRRELRYDGLSAATPYWYKLSCGAGVLIVGSFQTQASGSGTYPYTESFSANTAVKVCNDAAMSSGCLSQSAANPQMIAVASNGVKYWSPLSGSAVAAVGILSAP
jgi:hypothetical protein